MNRALTFFTILIKIIVFYGTLYRQEPDYFSVTVSNKNTHLPVFEIVNMCFSRVSPEPLELQKSYFFLFACLSKKNNFSNPVAKSADIFKNAVLPEKISDWKKSTIFKNSKKFFHGSKI